MKVYTTSDVAEMLQISQATVRNEVKRGSLNCFYVGSEARFTDWHLSEYMSIKATGKTEREQELEEEVKELKERLEYFDRAASKFMVDINQRRLCK